MWREWRFYITCKGCCHIEVGCLSFLISDNGYWIILNDWWCATFFVHCVKWIGIARLLKLLLWLCPENSFLINFVKGVFNFKVNYRKPIVGVDYVYRYIVWWHGCSIQQGCLIRDPENQLEWAILQTKKPKLRSENNLPESEFMLLPENWHPWQLK